MHWNLDPEHTGPDKPQEPPVVPEASFGSSELEVLVRPLLAEFVADLERALVDLEARWISFSAPQAGRIGTRFGRKLG